MSSDAVATTTHDPCLDVPELERLRYFHGQMLGASDLRGEQAYFREKLRLHNRYLHGHGVVCGLHVELLPEPEDCLSRTEKEQQDEDLRRWSDELDTDEGGEQGPGWVWDQDEVEQSEADDRPEGLRGRRALPERRPRYRHGPCIRVHPGLAIDCDGREILLREARDLDLWRSLSKQDQRRIESGHDTVYISICYCEGGVDPARPVVSHVCGPPSDCEYARIREGLTFRVTAEPPVAPARCESCCDDCPDPCVLLAEISGFTADDDLEPEDVDNGVRRMLARHRLTTITGISWVHGATYTRDQATDLLQGGFEVTFSDPIRVDSLVRGVLEIQVFEAGQGRAGDIYYMPGSFVDLPETEFTDRFTYRQEGEEFLQYADRVLITLRTDFILDECCRAVDGNHIGGRVPLVPGYERFAADRPDACPTLPQHRGPWTSGNGTQGGTFESWFFVEQGGRIDERPRKR